MILPAITILLFTVYSLLIIYYWYYWIRIPVYTAGITDPELTVSIIIPARNEGKNIRQLLESLQQQSYTGPRTEIIVVDDHSTDDTAEIVRQFPGVVLLHLENDILNSYKKKAIETGIAKATGELIITTDADCVAGADWLRTLVAFKKEYNPVFIAAPVCFIDDHSIRSPWLLRFQQLDFLVLQGITGVSVYKKNMSMCNGANLAYEKKVFGEVNGFAGIDEIASGDDMLLMHKIRKQYPSAVRYIKSRQAIMFTRAAGSWSAFFNQRIRWASKAKKYDDKRIFWILVLVYLFNLAFPLLLIAGCRNADYWWWALGFWIAKTLVEYPFVNAVASFFNARSLLKWFFFFQPFHILYTIIAGGLGQVGKYEWKGRKVK